MKAGLKQFGLWTFVFGLAVFLLYWSLRGTDWHQVRSLIAQARPMYIALPLCIMTLTLFLRSLRWRLLLTSFSKVAPSASFWATAAGYFGNNFLPARAGEAIRTLMISSGSALGKSYVLATALSERVVDAIVLVGISATVLLFSPVQPGWLARVAKPFSIAGFSGILMIFLLPRLESAGKRIVARIALPRKMEGKLVHILEECLRALRAFHNPSRFFRFLGYTGMIWLLDALSTIAGAKSLGLHMSLPAAFLLMAGLGLGSALPSTPGAVGVYQFVAVSILVPLGFSKSSAIAFILLSQALSWMVIGFWGSVGLLRYHFASLKVAAPELTFAYIVRGRQRFLYSRVDTGKTAQSPSAMSPK